MVPGKKARSALTLLAAALLALCFFAPTGTFASAHTIGQVKAKAETGTTPSLQPAHAPADTLREPCRPKEPLSAPEHLRHRQRVPACAQHPERTPAARRTPRPRPAARPGAPYHRATRSSAARTAAALQVFRC